MRDLSWPKENFGSLVFPMVDLDMRPDISWLIGMDTEGDDGLPGIILQAVQQTRYAMDTVGAKVENAAAVGLARGVVPLADHVIDRPFLAIVRRPGLTQPLFAGYIATDCWRKPDR